MLETFFLYVGFSLPAFSGLSNLLGIFDATWKRAMRGTVWTRVLRKHSALDARCHRPNASSSMILMQHSYPICALAFFRLRGAFKTTALLFSSLCRCAVPCPPLPDRRRFLRRLQRYPLLSAAAGSVQDIPSNLFGSAGGRYTFGKKKKINFGRLCISPLNLL